MKKVSIFFLIVCFFAFGKVSQAEDSVRSYNLTVSDISMTPSTPAVNQQVKITVTVKNNSNVALTSSLGISDYSYKFDNFAVSKISNDSPSYDKMIVSGDNIYYRFEGKFTAVGANKLFFFADSQNLLEESRTDDKNITQSLEDDNQISKDIEVAAAEYDLSIDSFAVNYDKIFGHPVEIKVNVKNTGKASLINEIGLSSFMAKYPSLPGLKIDSIKHSDFPSIDKPFYPNQIMTYTYNGTTDKIGNLSFAFTVDNENILKEVNESNNSSSTQLIIYGDKAAANVFNIGDIKIFPVSSTSIKVKWSTDVSIYNKVMYKQAYSGWNEIESSNSLNQAVTIADLYSGGDYTVQIFGSLNSIEKYTEPCIIKIPTDDQLFYVKKPAASVNSDKVKISWSTNLVAKSELSYKKVTDVNFFVSSNDSNEPDNSLQIEKLQPGRYQYFIMSTSSPGTVAQSPMNEFVIKEQVVTEPTNNNKVEVKNEINNNESNLDVIAKNVDLYSKLKGKIIIKTQAKGEAYYVNPKDKKAYYLGKPDDAFKVMRERGVGISNANLKKISLAIGGMSGLDSDGDGLPDSFETAIGTDKDKKDSDSDGYDDKTEISSNNNPQGKGKIAVESAFIKNNIGKIFIQVESKGEAWYVNPRDGKRYFLGRPTDAFNVMRKLGLGITNKDFENLSK